MQYPSNRVNISGSACGWRRRHSEGTRCILAFHSKGLEDVWRGNRRPPEEGLAKSRAV